jgi:cardiolipin synthase
MRSALADAALRGVDVRIVTPAIPDKKTVYRLTRANYQPLMDAGVKIYEYSPGFIHAKSMLCDDECAVVGSINLDYRSLYLHFENAVYFTKPQAIEQLKKDCENTFAVSKLCEKGYPKRTAVGRFFDATLRLFETLM